jgi:hypothetical protein
MLTDVNHLRLPESSAAARPFGPGGPRVVSSPRQVGMGGDNTPTAMTRRRPMTTQRRAPCPELMTPTRSCAKRSNITWPPEYRRTVTHSRSRSSACNEGFGHGSDMAPRGDAWCLHAHLALGPDPPAGRRPGWRPACTSTSGAAVRPRVMGVPAGVCALLGHQPAPSRICSSLPPTHDQAYVPSSAARPASPSSRGRNVSTMTASSSKNSAPIERS